MMTIRDDATNYHKTFALEKKSDTCRILLERKARVEKEGQGRKGKGKDGQDPPFG